MIDEYGYELTPEQERRSTYLSDVRHQMWLRHISGRRLSFALGCDASMLSKILHGNYPQPGDYKWPLRFEQYVYENFRIVPPGQKEEK